jgi:hypothetical protein
MSELIRIGKEGTCYQEIAVVERYELGGYRSWDLLGVVYEGRTETCVTNEELPSGDPHGVTQYRQETHVVQTPLFVVGLSADEVQQKLRDALARAEEQAGQEHVYAKQQEKERIAIEQANLDLSTQIEALDERLTRDNERHEAANKKLAERVERADFIVQKLREWVGEAKWREIDWLFDEDRTHMKQNVPI